MTESRQRGRVKPRVTAACLTIVAIAGLPLTGAAQVVETLAYQPDAVYPVRTALGIATQIELGAHEEVLDYSTGFSAGWEISRRDNVFYVKPRNIDVDTNLLVRTTEHAYIFELKVVATDWRSLDQVRSAGVHYRVRFSYPAGGPPSPASAPTEATSSALALDLDPQRAYHFRYDYTRHARTPHWLVPATVYDDRRFTYIRMGDRARFPSGNFPAVFARDSERGEEFVVNATVEDDVIVVHGTYPFLTVRHGAHVVGLRRGAEP